MCERCHQAVRSARAIEALLGVILRKAKAQRRYNRTPAIGRLGADLGGWLLAGSAGLLDYLAGTGRLEDLRDYLAAYHPVAQSGLIALEKAALTDRDRNFFAGLLAGYDYFSEDNLRAKADDIVKLHHCPTYEEAARFVLGKLGLPNDDFALRNPALRERILERREMAYFSGREGIDLALAAIVKHCAEAGDGPYNEDLLDKIQAALGYEIEGHAVRFAQTEIGFAAEKAQRDTFRQVGVKYKAWRHSGRGVSARPNHVAMDGTVIGMEAKFHLAAADGSASYDCDGPMDQSLPASEVVNCGCTLDPVYDAADEKLFREWDGS